MPLNRAFSAQVRAIVQRAKEDMANVVVTTIQDLNEEVVNATPVKHGNLRGHWTAGIGAPPNPAFHGADQGGKGTVARLNAAVIDLQMGQTYYAVNGAAYAARLEYGFVGTDAIGRTYNQAPRAFVRNTIARAPQIAEDALARIKGGA